jgi:hypothetical protein
MALKNVTVTLPEEMVRQAKHRAVDKGLSLSRYLADLLERDVCEGDQYEAARESAVRRLREGIDLGLEGRISWTRDDLHER